MTSQYIHCNHIIIAATWKEKKRKDQLRKDIRKFELWSCGKRWAKEKFAYTRRYNENLISL